MLGNLKKTLVPLATASALLGGIPSAQAVLKAGDMAGQIGVSYMLVDDASAKWKNAGAINSLVGYDKLKFKKDGNPVTTSFDFLYMFTNEIGLDFGLVWPAEIKQKLKHPHDAGMATYDGKYRIDIMPVHLTGRWFFMTPQDNFRPYVGLGAHYTDFRKAKINDVKFDKIHLDKNYGVLGQLGAVYELDDMAFVDGSFSYYYLKPDGKARMKDQATGQTIHHAKLSGAKINPMVFNISLGIKF